MKVVVDFLDLSQIFVLHLATCYALFTILSWVGEQNLIDHDVVNVDLLLRKLDCESLSFVHRQKLRNTYSYESSFACVLELSVNFFNFRLHAIQSRKQLLLNVLPATLAHHTRDRVQHSTKLVAQLHKLQQTLLEDCWEI